MGTRRPLRAQIELLLNGQREQAGLPAPLMSGGDRIEVVRQAYERAACEFGDTPRTFASRLGIRVCAIPVGFHSCEVAVDDIVAVTEAREPLTRDLLFWHGIAHVLLKRGRWRHSHTDAWIVTLELAAPWRAVLAHGPDAVARHAHAPEWAMRRWCVLSARFRPDALDRAA